MLSHWDGSDEWDGYFTYPTASIQSNHVYPNGPNCPTRPATLVLLLALHSAIGATEGRSLASASLSRHSAKHDGGSVEKNGREPPPEMSRTPAAAPHRVLYAVIFANLSTPSSTVKPQPAYSALTEESIA